MRLPETCTEARSMKRPEPSEPVANTAGRGTRPPATYTFLSYNAPWAGESAFIFSFTGAAQLRAAGTGRQAMSFFGARPALSLSFCPFLLLLYLRTTYIDLMCTLLLRSFLLLRLRPSRHSHLHH